METKSKELRRSQFAAPASERGIIATAAESEADSVLFDLEDSLAPNKKELGRELLIDSVSDFDWNGKKLSYRINGIDTRWWYNDIIDVVTAVGSSIDTIVVPKVIDRSDVRTVEALLQQVEINAGIEGTSIGFDIQIENATGMNNVIDILQSGTRVESAIFGPADYSMSVGSVGQSTRSKSEYPGHYWHYPLSRISHAAASQNVMAIGGPDAETEDIDQFRDSCRYERMLGFDGKIVVHPAQVPVANDVFSPTIAEAKRAQRIVEVYEASDDSEPSSFEGGLIDAEMYNMAKKIISNANKADII